MAGISIALPQRFAPKKILLPGSGKSAAVTTALLDGRGVAGVYPWEVAETKVDTLTSRAREAGYPLQATIEDA